MTTPPIGTHCVFKVKHSRLFPVRGYYMGMELGKWVVVESGGKKRTWKFEAVNVKGWDKVRSHKRGG